MIISASPLFPDDAPTTAPAPPPMDCPDLILSLTPQGQVATLGWPWAERCALSLSQFVGQPLLTLVEPEYRLVWEQALGTLAPGHSIDPMACGLTLGACRLLGTLGLWYPLGSAAPRIGTMAVQQVTPNPAIAVAPTTSPNRQLTQITWNIRRTLDLPTIWQQTVNGLGLLFAVDRGLICPYQPGQDTLTVVAEYCQPQLPSWQGATLSLREQPCLRKALLAPQPVVECWTVLPGEPREESGRMMLAVATRYQDQPNGLILMHLADAAAWSAETLDLVSELADQVGTAIAHAGLFSESQTLAQELQSVNQNLRQKHEELEEARRQAEEASRLKSEFLANTSHELRTPLNGMIGFLRLILDGMADTQEEQQEFLDEAHNSALHLLNLINDVLDIAKIEAGKMQLDMAQINLRELLQAVENFTRPQAERKGLAFSIRIPAARDEIILQGNYQRLLQVMLNLVGNAIKFTHEGEITITAEVKSQPITFQDQEWPGVVKISVKDTGIGVSLEKQDRLFQTFSQVDGERTRQYGGTGLGLAISQKLVEAMGGVVKFISLGEGLGATVTFTALLYQEPVLMDHDQSLDEA